jgi:hypothetical protein
MSKHQSFSYNEYRYILETLKSNIPILDFSDVDRDTTTFCIIRHDIEFSIERAYNLALIENEMNIATSYFVQLNNNTYNALSTKNLNLLNQINLLGHKIGLHFSPSHSRNKAIEEELFHYKGILEKALNNHIDRFSFHRPNLNPSILKDTLEFGNLINAYSSLFFQYFEGRTPENLEIKYVSDSNHQWRYGHPLEAIEQGYKKIQILFHPFSWSSNGGNNTQNFRELIFEKYQTMIDSFDSETSDFPKDEITKE